MKKSKRMIKRFTPFVAMCFVLTSLSGYAQDIHYSQFYMTPLQQNPAFTGFFDGSYRISGIARSQWGSVSVPYHTIGGAIDWNFRSGYNRSDMYGVGMNVMTDRAGDSQFTTTRVDFSTAYTKALDNFGKYYLAAGIQASYTSAYIDYTKLTFDENFENGQTTENFANTTARYGDVSTGLQYTIIFDKQNNLTMGGAVFHLNQPKLSFFGDKSSVVYRKYVANVGATYAINPSVLLFPKINYSKQGPNSELNFGAFARFGFKETKDMAMYFGALHRLKDAAIVVTRFDYLDAAFTFSYDFNYSKLARVSRGMGGPELSVQYIGSFKHKRNKKVFCPVF
jgi:type IX secretion system PorP/SprF family membrane protein